MNQLSRSISSLEVAEMVEREHRSVMRDIRTIIEHLGGEHKIVQTYFIQSKYEDSQGKSQPCFLLTKKGCELYGTRMTGEKGTQFAVAYIERFNQMEQEVEKPKSQLEIMQMSINQLVEQEKRLNEQEAKIEAIEEKQNNITEILSLNNIDWRNKVNRILNAIAMKLGGGQYFQELRAESYDLLEKRANCLLNKRLENRKSKMALRGQSKTAISKLSKLDVIGEDKKLISVYVTVIKEMAVKYQLNLADYQLVEGEEHGILS